MHFASTTLRSNQTGMQKILVIQQKMIGDVLATSIVCNNLRALYPDAEIHYLIYPFTKPVVENNPNIDRVILYDDKFRQSKIALFQFIMAMRRERYDIVIDAYGKLESNLIVAFSGARKKIGFYKSYTSVLYTDTIREIPAPLTNAGTAIENRLNLLGPLKPEIPLSNRPLLFLTDAEINNARVLLRSHNITEGSKLYMIGVIGSGENKTYPAAYMATLLDAIVNKTGATLLFNYIPKQYAEAKAIYDLCSPATQHAIKLDLVPGSLRDFMAVCSHCNALIGNEGGAVNMAKALMKPTFTIFSPWIKKEAWNSFEDGQSNVSVHLKDFRPELYGGKSPKDMKPEAMELYRHFMPALVFPQLMDFVERN
jgi:ADP-heptose:LPS heptosyltransferase